MPPRAVLVGLPGCGKSTIGRRLAKAMGLELVDTDAAIEQRTGRSIPDIFATDGEAEFRRIEEEVIREELKRHDGILSLGGGAITIPGVRAALAGHTVIYLEISADEGVRRTGGSTVRPLLAGPDRAEKYRTLMTERIPLYREVATLRVNTNRRNPGAVVRYVVTRLENPGQPRRRRPTWRRPGSAAVRPAPATDAPPASDPAPAPAATAQPASGTPSQQVTPATLAARRAGIRK